MTLAATYEVPITAPPSDRIVGFTPAGMLDWPGRVAATVFLSGCGFSCPFCHNPALRTPAGDAEEWSSLRSYLRMRRGWIDGVVVTGGEPTDDPGLVALLEAFAQDAIPVKLDTNGSNPELLGGLIAEQLIAYVAVDVKAVPDRYGEATGATGVAERVARTIDVVLQSGVPHEFRTTVYPGAVALEELPDIARSIEGADLFALQQFRTDRTLDPAAACVEPYHPDDLERARVQCARIVPTVLRGA